MGPFVFFVIEYLTIRCFKTGEDENMKKLFKIVMCGVMCFGLTCGVAGMMGDDANAADGCAAGKTKKAKKYLGGSGYPSTCRLNTCRTIGMTATKVTLNGSMPPVLVVVWQYNAVTGTAPTNACSSEVNSATWVMP